MHESKTLPSWSKITPVWNSIHLSAMLLFFCQPDVCSQTASISFLFSSHHTHLILCQLAKSILPFPLLPLNTSHLQNFSRQVSPMVPVNPPPRGYLQFTNCEFSEHTTCQEGESFWIRSNLHSREVRHTKADVSDMLCQQDFPLNYFLSTGYW